MDQYLAILDNPDSYPILIHCQAGLHRTGLLSAVYRMEYEGWTPAQAWREFRRTARPWWFRIEATTQCL